MRRRTFLTSSTTATVASTLLGFWAAGTQRNPVSPPVSAVLTPEGKPATARTAAVNRAVLDALPFDDRRDFDNAQRGFIAGLPNGVITSEDGKVFFDMKKYQIPPEAPAPDTMNPSLWRQAQLNSFSGLFKVVDGIYQLRSIDVANLTIVEGRTGLIVIDTIATTAAARAGLELYVKHRSRKPIKAIIYTHSHIDHYGGVAGLTTVEDVAAGRTKIIAPQGFVAEAMGESLYAGNAMMRRGGYQFGSALVVGPGANQTLGSGLGVGSASSAPSLIAPTDWVTHTGQKMVIDGVSFEFLMAPNSEAPAEMLIYIPSMKALCSAEDVTHVLHNFYTLRGAKTRDSSAWVKYLNQVLTMWGDDVSVMFASHNWPTWGNAEVR